MIGDWADAELDRLRAKGYRDNLEQEAARAEADETKLSDEELFAFDFKAYNTRLELRREQLREGVLKRHKVPEGLLQSIRLAQDPHLRDTALEVLKQYGVLSKEVFELVQALADRSRRTAILRLAKTIDLPALDQELFEVWANQPRLYNCSTCRVIGYWKASAKQQPHHRLCNACGVEEGERREKHARRDFSAVLSGARSRARAAKLPATLIQSQWLATLQHFQYRCAYCAEIYWEVIEHVTPIECGGGTTWSNCLPACYSCNGRKKRRSIEELPLGEFAGFDQNVIDKALAWLQQHGRHGRAR